MTEEDAEGLAKRWSGPTMSVPLDSGVSSGCVGDSGEWYTGEKEVLSMTQPEVFRYVLVTRPEPTMLPCLNEYSKVSEKYVLGGALASKQPESRNVLDSEWPLSIR